jgi:hypothetical protein
MTEEQQLLGALSLDLKRVAMAKFHNSQKVADIFWLEILKRKDKIKHLELPSYLSDMYEQIEKNNDKDNLLMYSVILQNYARN